MTTNDGSHISMVGIGASSAAAPAESTTNEPKDERTCEEKKNEDEEMKEVEKLESGYNV